MEDDYYEDRSVQRCRSCVYLDKLGGTQCQRFPAAVDVKLDYGCGEYKLRQYRYDWRQSHNYEMERRKRLDMEKQVKKLKDRLKEMKGRTA